MLFVIRSAVFIPILPVPPTLTIPPSQQLGFLRQLDGADDWGEPQEALNYYDRSLALYGQTGYRVGVVTTLNNMGVVLWGDRGNDTLLGQGVSDTFIVSYNYSSDMIFNFTDGSEFIGWTGSLNCQKLTIYDSIKGAQISVSQQLLPIISGIDATLISEDEFTVTGLTLACQF